MVKLKCTYQQLSGRHKKGRNLWFSGLRRLAMSLLMMMTMHTYASSIVNHQRSEFYDSCIKVACIGASTTYGATIENQPLNGFPEQLQYILGDEHWTVRNFGVNGAGVLSKGEIPYRTTAAWKAAIEFQPDVVIFNLGVNDVKPVNWAYKDEFIRDYAQLIKDFRDLPSKPKTYLCREVPVFKDRWGIRRHVVETELFPLKKQLVQKYKIPLIDLYTPLLRSSLLFADGIHPDKKGARIMAGIIAGVLSKDFPAAASYEGGGIQRRLTEEDVRTFPGKFSRWKGFSRYDFFLGLKQARLIIPACPAKGAPWVWRARFPDWHTDMDSILLAHGFYIFYLNTDGMLGSPAAIRKWDEAYRYLLANYQLSSKVALEGVSRGALFVYSFAKKFPERISCIYAEAPVCDIKSWPGGFYSSPGDSLIWEDLKREYHFSEKQALAFKDNPVDNLEPLAKRKIPIWHSIGLQDSLAPAAENTFILAKRYISLGGPVTIYPNTRSHATLHGHHFEIDDPMAGAKFIMNSAN